jgi:hypothetical protein
MWWNLKNFRPEPLLGYVPKINITYQCSAMFVKPKQKPNSEPNAHCCLPKPPYCQTQCYMQFCRADFELFFPINGKSDSICHRFKNHIKFGMYVFCFPQSVSCEIFSSVRTYSLCSCVSRSWCPKLS